MGFENRDYARDSMPPGGGGGFHAPAPSHSDSVIKYLLIANFVVFVLQNLTMDPARSLGGGLNGGVTDWLFLHVEHLRALQIWRLLTYGFCHSAEIHHIFFNMLLLWMFGKMVEGVIGGREFLYFYLVGIIVSGLCHVAIQVPTVMRDPDVIVRGVVGASGGVMAVAMMAAMLYPRQKILFMMIIPLELRWLVLFYVVSDVCGLIGGQSNNIANAAHLGGLAFGFLYHVNRWHISSWFGSSDRPRNRDSNRSSSLFDFSKVFKRKPDLKIYDEPAASSASAPSSPSKLQFDAKVDQILAKIHDQGEESLTDEERKILNEASRRYRDK